MSNRTDPLAATNVFSEESPQATQASGPSVAEARTEAAPGDDAPSQAVALPPQIGRYRVEAVLGTGGFGSVYRAFDEQLGRQVAIKVPDPRLLGRGVQAETYLREARLVAQLDHRHIVPVYDVGGTDEFPCFVVSRLMTGGDLAAKIQTARPGARESAQLVASIAAALHHAHKQGVAHRDIKPGNILLDDQGLPMLADFGLALDETTFGTGPALAGTPAYMSPEQARGEGHRVDGRSDIFSLGVVFYELLTGRRPFRGEKQRELLEQIIALDPRPPRQIDDRIPRELERICLKAMAKRVSERYTTASDLADDLHAALASAESQATASLGARTGDASLLTSPRLAAGEFSSRSAPPSATPTDSGTRTNATPGGASRTVETGGAMRARVVPKGLRSFDANDSDFFLDLLPGARDRDGLPQAVRFWKSHLESVDPANAFPVGLLYGPSGCGKSSLAKAGIMPRLNPPISATYFEATPEGTETRLLRALRRAAPDLPEMDLVATCTSLRRGEGLSDGQKVVLFIDQFEQWLHAHRAEEDTELARALRQCDGVHLQCVLMVRDDFWMSVTRFMRELEVRLVEGENSAAVDLFGPRHARRVLGAFGRAFGCLGPDDDEEGTGEAAAFVRQAVTDLTDQGAVIPVRLALFADMMKAKPWTVHSLHAVGGAAGIGAAFLEETFSAATAPPAHRYHEAAARRILKTLLYIPGQATSIKGRMRSRADLMDACGYNRRPQDFDDVLGILDGELRLITPTEPVQEEYASNRAPDERSSDAPAGAPQFYQLTHDYLVPALRDWLTRKQRETRRGRAELRLEEHSELWNSRPLSSHLPAWWEVGNILLLTRRKLWTPEQGKMMRAAIVRQGKSAALLAGLLVVLGIIGWETNGRIRAATLSDRVVQAETPRLPKILQELDPYRRWSEAKLRAAREQAEPNSTPWVNATLALLPAEPALAETLIDRSLRAPPEEFAVLRDALHRHREHVLDRLWSVLNSPTQESPLRIAAGQLLADFTAGDDSGPPDGFGTRWAHSAGFLAAQLVETAVSDTKRFQRLQEGFLPAGERLIPALQEIYRDEKQDASRQSIAMSLVESYGARNPRALADVWISSGDAERFSSRLPTLARQREEVLAFLHEQLALDPQGSLNPRWHDAPLDPAWPELSPALQRSIVAGQGAIAPRYAFFQTVPLAEFAPLAEGLRQSGYRPLRCRPYHLAAQDGNRSVNVAAVFTRDGHDWKVEFGLAAEQVQGKLDEWSAEGFVVSDVAGYQDSGFVYALLAEKSEDVVAGKALVGLTEADLLKAFEPLRTSPLMFTAVHVAQDESGALRYSWSLQQRKQNDASGGQFALLYLQPVSGQTIQRLLEAQPLPLGDLAVSPLPPPEAPQVQMDRLAATAAETLAKTPDDPSARFLRGYLSELRGSFDEALADYAFVLEKQPAHKSAISRRAALHARAGRAEAARSDLEALERQLPESFEAARTAALVAVYLGGHEPAFALAERRAYDLLRSGFYPVTLVHAYAQAAEALAATQPEQSLAYARRAVDWLRDELRIDARQILSEEGFAALHGLPEFQSYVAAGEPDRGYISVSSSNPGMQTRARVGAAPNWLQEQGRELADENWRPALISVAAVADGKQLVSAAGWERPVVSDAARDELGRRQARAAAATLRLDEAEPTWRVLRQQGDPRAREFLIEALPRLGAEARTLAAQLAAETQSPARRALILTLGGYAPEALGETERNELAPVLWDIFRNDPDSGVHAAADWLLRKWGHASQAHAIEKELTGSGPAEGKGWYVNRQGQTLAVVAGPVEFRMGAPDWEPGVSYAERLHKRRIERTFAIAIKEVTVEEMQRFLTDHPEIRKPEVPPAGAGDDWAQRPATATWWEAAQYCRWLSEREGIPPEQMCFPPIAEIKEGVRLVNPLEKLGYRLPSEAEWEYAARAGAETACSFGTPGELAGRYAWHKANSGDHLWPVGQLLPNGIGLFDVHGNALEWCHNVYIRNYPDPASGIALDLVSAGIVGAANRIQRGGWYGSLPIHLRSALRWGTSPRNRNSADGFRIARTIAVIRPAEGGQTTIEERDPEE